jgi:hypothetical protein
VFTLCSPDFTYTTKARKKIRNFHHKFDLFADHFSVLAAELTENAYAKGVPANATKLRRANWRL